MISSRLAKTKKCERKAIKTCWEPSTKYWSQYVTGDCGKEGKVNDAALREAFLQQVPFGFACFCFNPPHNSPVSPYMLPLLRDVINYVRGCVGVAGASKAFSESGWDEDGGRVGGSVGSEAGVELSLKWVVAPPRVVIAVPRSGSRGNGDSEQEPVLRLPCRATGDPAYGQLSVTWTHNRLQINSTKRRLLDSNGDLVFSREVQPKYLLNVHPTILNEGCHFGQQL
ncbi:unnamed protein product [Darwinula stevensoni]|uniref:Ig-like domain-containing protein n=1 Tax=Darwinula stevensoni TaxID=69355 RepID=A0A7R8ZZQ2_9CRUS|nr:unnamed protein product [Darwinula stevensoni]CAG0884193.1 unnamed protein product [Darwinula stevensoni]